MRFLQSVTGALHQWEWIGMLLARVSVGLLFFLSGAGKLFVPAGREQMRETMRKGGVPVPDVSAVVVSAVELVFGAFLVAGFLTPLACVMLVGVMLGALSTIVLTRIKAKSLVEWLGEFLYLPEVLYIVILVWLLFSGPGWLSVDHLMLSSSAAITHDSVKRSVAA